MALSTYQLSTNYRLELNLAEGTVDVPNNRSPVAGTLGIRKLSGSGRFQSGTSYWSVNVDGQTANGSIPGYDFTGYTFLTLWSGSFTITHNSDGSKTISVSGAFAEADSNIGSGTATGSLVLTVIPRASTPTFEVASVPVTSVDAGVALTIKTNRADATFTHSIEYAFGSLTGQTTGLGATTGVGTSTTFTPPLALLNEIPNALSGPLTVKVKTYNASAVLVGETNTILTLTVPAGSAYEPDFGTITNSEAVSAVATAIGAYVQGFTKLSLAITSPVGVYGSTIVSSRITVDGIQVLAATGAVGASGTMPSVITSSGTVAIVGTVVDSRGRAHSETVNVTVLAYTAPTFDPAVPPTFRRALSGGTIDENGTYMRTDVKASVASLIVSAVEKNTLTLKIYSRVRGSGSSYTLKATVASTGVITYNSHVETNPYAANQTFETYAEISDVLGSVVAYLGLLTTAGVPMHIGGPTEGVGIGMYSQHGAGTLDVFGQAYQKNGEPIQSAIAATETAMGPVELASLAESGAMLDLTRAVTPGGIAFLALATRNHNAIVNGAFRTNQRAYASGGALGASGYAHDRWRGSGVTNLIANPSLETNTTGWQSSTGNLTLSRVTTGHDIPGITTEGSAFGRLTATATAAVGSGFSAAAGTVGVAAVSPLTMYMASVWVRSSKIQRVRMFAVQLTSGGATAATNYGAETVLAANTWTRLSVQVNSVSTAASFRIGAENVAGTSSSSWLSGDTFDFDCAMVTIGSALWPYSDGASPDSAWTGTAHASTSVRGPATNSYSFTAAPQGQQITLASGSGLLTILERAEIGAGSRVLSWSGTATARVYNVGTEPGSLPSFSASGLIFVADGLDDVVVEFRAVGGTKTLSNVQFELGSYPTPFEQIPQEQEIELCQRYYWRIENPSTYASNMAFVLFSAYTTSAFYGVLKLPTRMRALPVGRISGGGGLQLFYQSVNTTSSTVVVTQPGLDLVRVDITTGGSLTAGYSGWAELRPGFYFEVEAEM